MPVVAPTTNLQAIQNKVRRLTRSPSTSQLTDSDLQNYINTFVVYDFPEHLRTFNLRTTFTFYTNPYQDEYPTDIASFGTNPSAVNNPLYDFQNKYLTIHPPIYSAGRLAVFTQTREELFGFFPKVNFIQSIGQQGDGVTTQFSGVISSQQSQLPSLTSGGGLVGLLQRQVLFDSVDSNFAGLSLVDVPVINALTGNPTTDGNLYDPASAAYQAALATPPTTVDATNTINYATGVYTITFSSAPGADAIINSQTVPQALSRPTTICYYANKFIVRPVPDQPYRIDMEVYQAPVYMDDTGVTNNPELNEYWQYIAFSVAKKILEDRLDMDSVNLIMPALKEQEMLVQRRNLVQYANQQVPTIYNNNPGWGFGNYGNGQGWW